MKPDNGRVRWSAVAAATGVTLLVIVLAYTYTMGVRAVMGVRATMSPASTVAEGDAVAGAEGSTDAVRCWLVTGVEMLDPINCLSRGGRLKQPLRPPKPKPGLPAGTIAGDPSRHYYETPSYSGGSSGSLGHIYPSRRRSRSTSGNSSPRSFPGAMRSGPRGIR